MVTMQDVAARANVSITTVSFVVNGTKPVSPQTRERITKAIEELGYRRNAMARALASRKSRTIALIYPLLEHHNHHSFVASAAAAAEEREYHLVLWPIHSGNATAEIASLVQTGMADGVLLMEVQLEDERVNYLQQAKAPFALIGRTRELTGIDYVDIDFEHSTETAIESLAALGHTNIALVIEDFSRTPLAQYSPPIRVEEVFRTVMSTKRLSGTVFRVSHDTSAMMSLADDILRTDPETTAIIAMHDEAALALVMALPERGMQIPRDVSIVGIASATTIGGVVHPPLTTYEAPGGALGRLAAEALIARLEGGDGPPTQVLVPCPPHLGASVGPAPSRAPIGAKAADSP